MIATTQQLIDAIGSCQRGQIFLINLEYSRKHGLDSHRFMAVLQGMCDHLVTTRKSLTPEGLVEELGRRCASSGLWRHSDEPHLHFFRAGDRVILSRLTTYGGFWHSILDRDENSAPLDEVPCPLAVGPDEDSEILDDDIPAVRAFFNDNVWRKHMPGVEVRLNEHCNWLAPLTELLRRTAFGGGKRGDRYRDMVGLSHYSAGVHLIRLDFDIGRGQAGLPVARRRPNGACNGGNRFRMEYDQPIGCNWGRTVDLSVVAGRLPASLNGVPELVMEPFSVPLEAMSTRYIGAVTQAAEQDDRYFLSRIGTQPSFVHP